MVFPVRVVHEGETVFVKTIPIRADFFGELKTTKGWKESLLRIFRTRIKEEVIRRQKAARISIVEKIDFMELTEGQKPNK